ncbi:phospholipase A2 isozymes PA3A/PA3B/PA5-like [Pseudophryne corroboree]|uniref:phospholipase A2 isozymes PA3A/PA3B/PA5-like n=1 Tax=Pseudophryne corroboree TaxID=495146 RepID=UPI003081556E
MADVFKVHLNLLAALWVESAHNAAPSLPVKWTNCAEESEAGNSAGRTYTSCLFRGVDLCCREHDHCFPQIKAFEYQYGIRNYRLHTVKHCDCDDSFRLCLQAINDAISTFVGIMYFHILEVPCFSLREEEQCVEWHWFGGCKRNGMAPKAEFQKPDIFNYTNPEGNYKSTPLPRTTSHPLKYPAPSSKLPSVTSVSPSLSNAKKRKLQRNWGRYKESVKERVEE